MEKENVVIGVTPVEFENMPESLIGKYTLAVEGVCDLYSKRSNVWVKQRKKDPDAKISNKCNMQKAISISMTNKCVSLEALSILMRMGRKPALVSMAKKSEIPHAEYHVKNRVLYNYNLMVFDSLENGMNMAKFYVDNANKHSTVLERCSYEATGLL